MIRSTDRTTMTIAVDLGRKATKQTKQKNFLNKAISIINFAKLFQNFIDDTMI